MSYQIVKNLREDNGDIVCEMVSNNVWPKTYYEWRKPNTSEWRKMVHQLFAYRVWQSSAKNLPNFIND